MTNNTPQVNKQNNPLSKVSTTLETGQLDQPVEQLDQLCQNVVKEKLASLRKMQWVGYYYHIPLTDTDAACNVTLTSQYEMIEIAIHPSFLIKIVDQQGINTKPITVDKSTQICAALGDAFKAAFHDAKNTAQGESQQLVDNLIKALPSNNRSKEQAHNLENAQRELDDFRKQSFVGTFSLQETEAQQQPSCCVKINSRYEVVELVIASDFLLSLLDNVTTDTKQWDLQTLMRICDKLEKALSVTCNHAVEKVSNASAQVFGEVTDLLRSHLTSTHN